MCTQSHKRLRNICMFTCSCTTTNHLVLFPSQLLDSQCLSLHMYSIYVKHSHSLYFLSLSLAPWSCEARHFVPLYVPTCSGMTIKLNLNLNEFSALFGAIGVGGTALQWWWFPVSSGLHTSGCTTPCLCCR